MDLGIANCVDLVRSLVLFQHQIVLVVGGRQREESLYPVQLTEEAKAEGHGGDGSGFGMKKVGLVYTLGVTGKSELPP